MDEPLHTSEGSGAWRWFEKLLFRVPAKQRTLSSFLSCPSFLTVQEGRPPLTTPPQPSGWKGGFSAWQFLPAAKLVARGAVASAASGLPPPASLGPLDTGPLSVDLGHRRGWGTAVSRQAEGCSPTPPCQESIAASRPQAADGLGAPPGGVGLLSPVCGICRGFPHFLTPTPKLPVAQSGRSSAPSWVRLGPETLWAWRRGCP